MSATNFNTSNSTYRQLIGNGLTYNVPPFQRDYSWEDEEWQDLWEDILETTKDDREPAHYMGYLVLQSNNEKQFNVIDGQQRITTLSIVILAALKNLDRLVKLGKNSSENQIRLTQIRHTYIGFLDPVTLQTKSKLTLNRNNDRYFQDYMVTLVDPLPQRGFNMSVHRLRKAFEWFEKQIAHHIGNSTDEGFTIASLIETMSDRLFFTVISVTDELNAYKVFETLNARGVRLSSTDLLKNYLFSVLHKENREDDLKWLEERWESLVSRLGTESFPDFLRHHWNSQNGLIRHSEVFKVIRHKIKNSQQVFEFIQNIDADIDTYRALTEPELSHWDKESKEYAKTLKMFKVKQPFPLIIAAKRSLPDSEFTSLLRSCCVIAFRYNVIGNLPTGESERIYCSAAYKIHLKMLTSLKDILFSIKELYPTDDKFKRDFSEKIIRTADHRNNKVVRYLLCKIEKAKYQIMPDFEDENLTIEHILPQNPQNGWQNFNDEEASAMVFRIGNMVLLEKNLNKKAANLEYCSKSDLYSQSHYSSTKEISKTYSEWTFHTLMSRQNDLAALASCIWRIEQLS